MQQCGSAIRNVVADAKFDFFICPSLKRLVWPKFISLREGSQVDFLPRNVDVSLRPLTEKRQYLKSLKIDVFFSN